MKSITINDNNAGQNNHRKGHRRQESMYTMTGLYSDNGDDSSSVEMPGDSENGSNKVDENAVPNFMIDTVIKCHSRQPSTGIIDQRDKNNDMDDINMSVDCGILNCRPKSFQKFARIKIFVLLLSMLVTLQQALSSGYINSVITTIEKRFEIPSSYSGLIASSYEIGNVITVIFVSYLGSRRHIPVWIGIGAIIMAIGSLIFMLPHFTGEENPSISMANDNICRSPYRELDLVGRLANGLSNPPLVPHNNLREDNCIKGKSSTFGPVLLFVIAQMLLGCGGSPLFTLGTTYVDDHVRTESASIHIGFMYSMAAFGPVLGFLLGAYSLSFHMDALSAKLISINPGDPRWIGMWWGGFFLCGLLLLIVAIPFFSFPKVLTREKKKLRNHEEQNLKVTSNNTNSLQRQTSPPTVSSINQKTTSVSQTTSPAPNNLATEPSSSSSKIDSGYGKDIKDIPSSMWRLVSNPIYICTCLGACMELMIVSGFIVFLPKYLETQFSLGKSQASVFTGSVAIPGACIGIFLGGCFLKRFELKPKGAVQFVLISNLICLACYGLLFFLGCDNPKMAGTTIPYYNSTTHTAREPFQVNLTAACNFGCECHMADVEPVCGNNGLTYFSPCHAGCTISSGSDFTNCACVQSNQPLNVYKGVGGSEAQASIANEEFKEVTVVPVATNGPCSTPCRTIYPFLLLLFFMTFIVASTQMPLLMIVLRSVSEEERSFALGMQFVIFRLFGYIPAPILFGNLIDSTCILWKSTCGEKGGRCLIYDIETFRYKYVGLCATIKVVALAIFAVDWWLVRRRKQLEYTTPLSATAGVGSIISLDKLFMEKGAVENAGSYANDVLSNDISSDVPNYDPNKKILIATRHNRNDSKGIQIEFRYDGFNENNPENMKKRQHIRSNSDVIHAVGRSNSREYDSDYRNRRLFHPRSHSRNNSRDLDFDNNRNRRQPTHSRTSSRDEPMNIKYILNCLKPDASTNRLLLSSAAMLAQAAAAEHGTARAVRPKHNRNHSYDQIYNMPNNIKIDQELHKKFIKNQTMAPTTSYSTFENDLNAVKASAISNNNNMNKEYLLDNKLSKNETAESTVINIGSHSRNNSKDLNKSSFLSSLVDDSAANNILRHRRTNSKETNRILNPIPSTSNAGLSMLDPPQFQTQFHKRNVSLSKNELPKEVSTTQRGDAIQDPFLIKNDTNVGQTKDME